MPYIFPIELRSILETALTEIRSKGEGDVKSDSSESYPGCIFSCSMRSSTQNNGHISSEKPKSWAKMNLMTIPTAYECLRASI